MLSQAFPCCCPLPFSTSPVRLTVLCAEYQAWLFSFIEFVFLFLPIPRTLGQCRDLPGYKNRVIKDPWVSAIKDQMYPVNIVAKACDVQSNYGTTRAAVALMTPVKASRGLLSKLPHSCLLFSAKALQQCARKIQ